MKQQIIPNLILQIRQNFKNLLNFGVPIKLMAEIFIQYLLKKVGEKDLESFILDRNAI